MGDQPVARVSGGKTTCPECGKECGHPKGLGIHRRYKHGVRGQSPAAESRRRALAAKTPRVAKNGSQAPEVFVAPETTKAADEIRARAQQLRQKADQLDELAQKVEQILADIKS